MSEWPQPPDRFCLPHRQSTCSIGGCVQTAVAFFNKDGDRFPVCKRHFWKYCDRFLMSFIHGQTAKTLLEEREDGQAIG